MHQAWWSGVIAKSSSTPDLRTLLIAHRRETVSPEAVKASVRMWLGGPAKE